MNRTIYVRKMFTEKLKTVNAICPLILSNISAISYFHLSQLLFYCYQN